MNVRHKDGGGIWYDVLDESPKYYIAQGAQGALLALSKEDWEPQPVWQDMTAQYTGEQAAMLLANNMDTYRLVRYEVNVLQKARTHMAYIMERKVQQ